MKKKYLKYFVFLMVSFLSTSFFIGRVKAAGIQCNNVMPTLTGNLQYRSTKWGGHALNPDAWGVHTFWTIRISGTSAFCMDYQKHLNSKTSLNVIECKDAQIKSSTTGSVDRAKKAAKYCAGKACSSVDSTEYLITQSYAWGFTETEAKAEACSKLYNYGTGVINSYKRKQIISCMTAKANDEEDDSAGFGNKAHRELDKKIQNIYYGIAHTTINSSDSFTCWQSKDGASQPLIAYKKTTCEENIVCIDKTGVKDITSCVSDCMSKDKTKTKAVCKTECEDKWCPNEEPIYCPPGSAKEGTEITECVKTTGDQKQCEKDLCYDATTKSCDGYAYGYVGSLPLCTDDGNSKTATFIQEPIGTADDSHTGDKENGVLIKRVGTYGALYCRETAASVNLPSGLISSIRLGGYLIWPTYSSGVEMLDTTFGNMYPLSFQGKMECHYQIAPHIYTKSLCQTNYTEMYKTAFEDNSVGLLKAANSDVTQARNGVTQVDKISGNNEFYSLGKYFNNSNLTLKSRNTDSTGHTREYIRNFNSNGIVTQVCNAPEVVVKDETNEDPYKVTNRFVLSDELEVLKGTSPSILSANNWEIFVINSEVLKSSNKALANATKEFDFSQVKLDTTGKYKFTMKYEIGTTTPSASSPSVSGYIKVVDSLTETSETVPSYSLTCGTEILKTGNLCNTNTEKGCADNSYFSILENWRKDNHDYWEGMYNTRLNTCKEEKRDGPCKHRDPVTNKCTSRDRIKKGTSWCKQNDNLTKTYAARKEYWSETGTVGKSITTAKNNFNNYADKYNALVELYMELWNVAYNQDLKQCVDSTDCPVYNFETSARLEYKDETNTEYPNYGHLLSIANTWKYHCNVSGTNSGACGNTPLVTMKPGGLNGDDKFNYTKWIQKIYQLNYSWLVDQLKPDYVKDLVNDIEDATSTITTDRIDYKLNEAETYHFVDKSSINTKYIKTLPTSNNINFIPLNYTSGVLPTSYKNNPSKKYDLALKDIKLGNAWSGLNLKDTISGMASDDINKNTSENDVSDEYICKYQVTNNLEDLKCPPGTINAGMPLDLADIVAQTGKPISFEEAVEKYCDNPTPDLECKNCYCEDTDGKLVDITTCLKSNGWDWNDCAKKWCPSTPTDARFYCPDKQGYYKDKEITSCVQKLHNAGNSVDDSRKYCEETLCPNNKLFVYRTIDLNNPFPSMDADDIPSKTNSKIKEGYFNLNRKGRFPGSNWFNGYMYNDVDTHKQYSYVYTKIIHNRGTTDGKAYDIYTKKTPLYHFELDTATIREVRKYNASKVSKKLGYADSNLTCMKSGKYVGMACVSNFLHGALSDYPQANKGFIKNKSQCGNANTPNQLVKCLYEDTPLTGTS